MEIKREINSFYELADMVWSGAVDTITDIQNANKENEFMDFIENVFFDEVPTDTQLNDFIWFEREYIYENMGLDENGEVPMERIDESEINWDEFETFDDFCNEMDCDTCPFGDLVNACEDLFEDYKTEVESH